MLHPIYKMFLLLSIFVLCVVYQGLSVVTWRLMATIKTIEIASCSDVIIRSNTATGELEILLQPGAILGIEHSTMRIIHEGDMGLPLVVAKPFIIDARIFLVLVLIAAVIQLPILVLAFTVCFFVTLYRRGDNTPLPVTVTRRVDNTYRIHSVLVSGTCNVQLYIDQMGPRVNIVSNGSGRLYVGREHIPTNGKPRFDSLDVTLNSSGSVNMGGASVNYATLTSRGTGSISDVNVEEHALVEYQGGGKISYSRAKHCIVVRKQSGIGSLVERRH